MTFPLAYDLDSASSYHEIAAYFPKPATAQGSLSVPLVQKARERVPTSLTTLSKHNRPPNCAHPQPSSSSFFPDATGLEFNPKRPTGGEELINPWAGVITRPCTFIVPFHPPAPSIQALQLTHPHVQVPVVEFEAVISGPATFSVPLRPPAPPSYRSQSPPTPYADSFAQPWSESATESISQRPPAWGSVQPPSPPMYEDYYYPLNDESSSPEVVSDTDADKSLAKQLYMDRLPTMKELEDEGYPEVWKSVDGIQLVPIDLAHFDEFCMSLIDGSFFENESAEARTQEEFESHTLN